MRTKTTYKRIAVSKSIYNRIIKDRKHFQKLIGGGTWSISDVLKEYYKIMDLAEK